MAKGQALAQHLFGVEQRRAERDEVFFTTRLMIGEGRPFDVQLVNLSPYGFMVRSAEQVTERSIVRLMLPVTGPVPARVVWGLGGRIGGEFLAAIAPADYHAMLIEAQRLQTGLWRD